MRQRITGSLDLVGRVLANATHCRGRLLLIMLFASVLVLPTRIVAQTTPAGFSGEKTVAVGMAAITRHVEKLDVPRKAKASLAVQTELSSWATTNRAREITVPPRGFYIATLGNGSVVTVINKEEKLRHAGEMWAVQDGQSMTVKIQDKKQENVVLQILSLSTGH